MELKTKVDVRDMLRTHDLSIEELRSFPLFARFSDQQAAEAIATIKTFTQIVYKCHEKAQDSLGKNAEI